MRMFSGTTPVVGSVAIARWHDGAVSQVAILLLVPPDGIKNALPLRDSKTEGIVELSHACVDHASLGAALGLPDRLRYEEACVVAPAPHPVVHAAVAALSTLTLGADTALRLFQCEPPFDRSRMKRLAFGDDGR